MRDIELSRRDIDYILDNFRSLEQVCRDRGEDPAEVRLLIRERQLPAPSYVLADGDEMVPEDYFLFVDEAGGPKHLRQEYERRYRAAGGAASVLAEDWNGYMDGVFGVCLRAVSPETIVRKSELVRSIEGLLANAAPEDLAWQEQLRNEVDELDSLEREFSPDHDRQRFATPPSRDRLIATAREHYPAVFAKGGVRAR
jgi:hypothetical protein